MLKIHYHSECSFFAGCENMLTNFFNSESFRQTHTVSFSYVQSALYTQGLRRRVNLDLSVWPITFPNLAEPAKKTRFLPELCRKILVVLLRLVKLLPFFAYQIIILYWLFKKIGPDILHVNNGGYPAARSALAAVIAARLAGISKVLMVVNNMAVDYRHYWRWFDYPIDRLVVRCVNVFVTGSQAAGERLGTVLNLPDHQRRVIHNGIDLRIHNSSIAATRNRLGLNNFEGTIFGVVALLIPRKGHQILLDAVLELVTDNKLNKDDFVVLIEGSGPLYESLVDFVVLNNLTPWVTFVGEESNVVDFMSALDVLILPSVQDEDFPNVISEAMALGKPVIASRLAGTPEQVLDGDTGLLVDPYDVQQLAGAILQLASNPNLRESMGLAALQRFGNHFTSQIALSNYAKLYAEIIENSL